MITTTRQTILIVDDSAENLSVLSTLLRGHYRVLAATTGEAGLRVASNHPPPDLILLDVVMKGLDGYAVLSRLRENPATRDTPVVFLTSLSDAGDIERGLELGAADYITKPIMPVVVLARVRTQLEAKQARDGLKIQNQMLNEEVNRRMIENNLTQLVSIRALAHLAETRDPETGNHIRRTQGYVQELAKSLKKHPRFTETLSDRYIELLTRSAPLHDIGKVGIPDHILLKPAKLSPDEMTVMQTHAKLGSHSIEMAESDIEMPLDFLSLAKEITRWHHERWDGTGYPDGLAEEAIPVSARLMTVADVFDALISDRIYKQAMTCSEAREIICSERGKQFDPDIVDAFCTVFENFVAIAKQYQDSERFFPVSDKNKD